MVKYIRYSRFSGTTRALITKYQISIIFVLMFDNVYTYCFHLQFIKPECEEKIAKYLLEHSYDVH